MSKKKLNQEELEKVSGGSSEGDEISFGLFHNDCGGKLLNVNNPVLSVECAKCHASHYFTVSFDRYKIYKRINYGLRYYHAEQYEYYAAVDDIGRPEELDWPCNRED